MLFDSHCHIQFKGYKDDRDEVILRCREKDVLMNAIGTQKDTSKKAVELAEKYDNIYATIGLHPIHLHATQVDEEESSFLSHEEDFDEKYYDELAKSDRVIAVGECGLELYHVPNVGTVGTGRDLSVHNLSEILEKQRNIFIKQYNFAVKHNLPLVIHVRDPEPQGSRASAYGEMVELLSVIARRSSSDDEAISGRQQSQGTREIASSADANRLPRNDMRGVVHCYSSNWQNAQKFLDLGFYLGFTGVITFPARKTNPQPTLDLLEVVEKCPLDRILVETDAPYLAPQAYRGQRCEPWMVEEVVKKIAEIKNKSFEEIKKITLENTLRLFKKIKI